VRYFPSGLRKSAGPCGTHPRAHRAPCVLTLRKAQALAASLDARSTESWGMPETARQQKITFGEMRESGIDRILIYCADFRCSHSIQMSADRWPDHVRLSDIEPHFVCKACGKRGAEVRGLFTPARMGTG
jgi:hypothetical protein